MAKSIASILRLNCNVFPKANNKNYYKSNPNEVQSGIIPNFS